MKAMSHNMLYGIIAAIVLGAVIIGMFIFFKPDVMSAISQIQQALRIGG